MPAFELGFLTLGELFTSGKGAKSLPVTYSGNHPIQWTPEPQQVAFEPSAFGGEDVARVNLVMTATSETSDILCELDERMVTLVTENSGRIFGKTLTRVEVEQRFTSSVKFSEKGYASTFKCKINLSGRGAIQCWDADRNKREPPTSWVQCRVQPKITLKNIWIMAKQWGILYEAVNILVGEASEECPFDN